MRYGRRWIAIPLIFFSSDGAAGFTFKFSALAFGGHLPTHAGVVWTDGGGRTKFEAFDQNGVSLGVLGPFSIGDGTDNGTTADDRFFGAVNAGGVSAIHISNEIGGIEVDHLQYGLASVPEPGSLTLLALGLATALAAGLRRRIF